MAVLLSLNLSTQRRWFLVFYIHNCSPSFSIYIYSYVLSSTVESKLGHLVPPFYLANAEDELYLSVSFAVLLSLYLFMNVLINMHRNHNLSQLLVEHVSGSEFIFQPCGSYFNFFRQVFVFPSSVILFHVISFLLRRYIFKFLAMWNELHLFSHTLLPPKLSLIFVINSSHVAATFTFSGRFLPSLHLSYSFMLLHSCQGRNLFNILATWNKLHLFSLTLLPPKLSLLFVLDSSVYLFCFLSSFDFQATINFQCLIYI